MYIYTTFWVLVISTESRLYYNISTKKANVQLCQGVPLDPRAKPSGEAVSISIVNCPVVSESLWVLAFLHIDLTTMEQHFCVPIITVWLNAALVQCCVNIWLSELWRSNASLEQSTCSPFWFSVECKSMSKCVVSAKFTQYLSERRKVSFTVLLYLPI